MKNTYLFILFFCSVVLLSGCQSQSSAPASATDSPTTKTESRQGDTTLTGKIVKTGDTFAIVDSNGKQTEIDSYKIELTDYAGKQVSITGQYSGDTLFVAVVTIL